MAMGEVTYSLLKMEAQCVVPVGTLTTSCSAIWGLVNPLANQCRTSCSRLVSLTGVGEDGCSAEECRRGGTFLVIDTCVARARACSTVIPRPSAHAAAKACKPSFVR